MKSQHNDDLGYNGFNVSLFYLAPIPFENIQDPNVNIALKNITKKNAVTKEKRLGEFLRLLENRSFDITDYYVLMCWIQLYPRLALDISKPVRHLAHQVQAAYMEMYGAKDFSPYLKSSLPIWLQGLYDDKSIAVSVKASLLKNFTNDEEKVNSKIWIVFHEQIINYCHHVLVHESANSISDERSDSPEELRLKYERAMVSALLMLTKTLGLANTSEYFISETAQEQIEEILKLEKLWDHLASFSGEKTLNLSLFKSLLALIAEVFTLDSQNLKAATSRFGDLKSIYKVISKKFIKLVKVGDSKQPSTTYTAVIIPLLNVLTVLTRLTSLANLVDKKAYKLKKNFWQIGGSKSYSRLNDYIKLGPCNSDPVYYRFLRELFSALESSEIASEGDFSFINFKDIKDANKILDKYLLPQISKLIGPNAMAFKQGATRCFIDIYKLFEKHIELSNEGLKYNVFLSILDGLASSRIRPGDQSREKECLVDLADFAKAQCLDLQDLAKKLLESEDSNITGQNFNLTLRTPRAQILAAFYSVLVLTSESSSNDFLTCVFEKLEESFEANVLSDLLTCLVSALKISDAGVSNVRDWATQSLPGFITSEFVDIPLSLIECIVERSEPADLNGFFDDCFTKINSECPQKIPKLLTIACKHNVLKAQGIEKANPEIYEYLSSLANQKERLEIENELVLNFILNPRILKSVTSDIGKQGKQKLLGTLIASGETLDGNEVLDLIHFAASSCDETSQKFLGLVKDQEMVQRTLYEVISTCPPDTDFSKLASYVIGTKSPIVLARIGEELTSAFNHVDLSSLALANPLGQNIYLFSPPLELKLFSSILPIKSFLGDYLRMSGSQDLDCLLWFAKASEYCQDFEFLCETNTALESSNASQSFYSSKTFKAGVTDSEICEIFNGTSAEGLCCKLSDELGGKGPFNPHQYYASRALVHSLSNSFEVMSLANFDKLEIQYTKLAGSPLKLATFFCCAQKFVGHSAKFDRVRNYVFAEILGVRSTSDILASGLTWIALATNFLNDVQYDILPNHKMAMVINQISGWLATDIAYEDSFESMRVLLSQFLTRLISVSGENVPDKTWEVSVDLCLNNLSTALVKPGALSLKYFSVKLFVALLKHVDQTVYPQWPENKVSLYQDIFECLSEPNVSNQPVNLVNQLLERVLNGANFLKEFLSDNSSKLYNLLSSSKFEELQRIATSLLQKQIYELQQDVIIEYQFKAAKDVDDELNVVDEMVKLPSTLLSAISDLEHHLDDFIAHEKFAEAFKYVWSWLLIFAHFEDSTISMKAAYIEQIKQNGTVEKLLGTIFDCIDLTDSKYLNSLVVTPIEKGSKVSPENCLIQKYLVSQGLAGHSSKEALHFLLSHLYYLSFRFLGTFAQQWFQDLRDLQLKQQIQKFSVNYISPILISKMLDDVENTKDKLTQGDENFTIKVNRVTNEIKSSYIIDEQNMEMVVKIPEAFPLSKVSVEGPLRLGVKENQWKAWLMASQRVISLTNGSITDCIELFNKNVNLHFSGFEECAICYSILHQDHSLPSKVCPTCLNKFHSACLYKWFKSSGSSTCPLCRCTFNFNSTRS